MAGERGMRIRLGADTSELQKKLKESQKSIKGFTSNITGLQKAIAGVAAAAGLVALTRQAVQFGRDSARAFAEAEVVWNRLGGTLRTVGVDFANVRGEIETAARSMQDATTIGDEEFADTLQRIVAITGDYRASLGEVETAANLAVGAQVDLKTAAQLVGRAMVGDTATLKRYGVVIAEGADAMETLRTQFAGMAANEATTLDGRLKQLSNAWGDLKEELGGIIAGGDDAADTVRLLTEQVQALTRWLTDHSGEIEQFRDDLVEIASIAKEPIVITLKIVGDVLGEIADRLRELRETRAEMDGFGARFLDTPGGGFEGTGAGGSFTPQGASDEELRAAREAAARARAAARERARAEEEAAREAKRVAEEMGRALRQLDQAIHRNVRIGLGGAPTSGGIGLRKAVNGRGRTTAGGASLRRRVGTLRARQG
jgi:hypothetical protein